MFGSGEKESIDNQVKSPQYEMIKALIHTELKIWEKNGTIVSLGN